MAERTTGADPGSREGRRPQRPLPVWAKVLLVVSIVVMLVGGGLYGYALITGGDEEPAPAAARGDGSGSDLAPGFAAVEPSERGDAGADAEDDRADDPLKEWSPAIFRLGFSFFIGFVIAYALRSFLRIALVLIGLVVIAIFGLQYAGVLPAIDWDRIGAHFDTFGGWLGEQTATAKDFITGQLPSAASAIAGMVAGFRRRG